MVSRRYPRPGELSSRAVPYETVPWQARRMAVLCNPRQRQASRPRRCGARALSGSSRGGRLPAGQSGRTPRDEARAPPARERTTRSRPRTAVYPGPPASPDGVVLAVDFGSTFTKLAVIDVELGRLVARATVPTSTDEVLQGFDDGCEALTALLDGLDIRREVHACSSAGGGLRIAVVGLEADLTARAGKYAAMSAGARVVEVIAGGLDERSLRRLWDLEPDIILVTGGIDDGDEHCVLTSTRVLADAECNVPVVVAGNRRAGPAAMAALDRRAVPAMLAENVMPRPGELNLDSARAALRELFIAHVIGGKELSRNRTFAALVRMATPDAVLAAVELMSGARPGAPQDVVVVDVGGATTDVHSAIAAPMAAQGMRSRFHPEASASRTVEADLGLRANALGIVEAGIDQGLIAPEDVARYLEGAERRSCDPGLIATRRDEREIDLGLARIASCVALARHAGRLRTSVTPSGAVVESDGKDLRGARLLVGTGGIFEHGDRLALAEGLAAASDGPPDSRRLLPRQASLFADRCYSLAAVGLIGGAYPEQARELLSKSLAPLRTQRNRSPAYAG